MKNEANDSISQCEYSVYMKKNKVQFLRSEKVLDILRTVVMKISIQRDKRLMFSPVLQRFQKRRGDEIFNKALTLHY